MYSEFRALNLLWNRSLDWMYITAKVELNIKHPSYNQIQPWQRLRASAIPDKDT